MPKVMPVIQSDLCRGEGTIADRRRTVTQYHTLMGDFLAEHDPVDAGFDAANEIAKERDRLLVAIRWALGEEGEFPEHDPKKPYGWRTELRRRAGF